MKKNQLLLLGIFALFFAPLILAVLMQSRWWTFETAMTTNAGRLVEPPVTVADPRLERGKWWMLYVADSECAADCEADVTGLRQVHRGSGRHQDVLGVAVFAERGFTTEAAGRLALLYDQFVLLEGNADGLLAGMRQAAGESTPATDATGYGFVMDPAGNIMLAYAPGYSPSDVNKDLKRLLKWSRQDES